MAVNIGTRAGRHHGPNGSFEGCRVPYSGAVNALLIINPRSGRGGPAPAEIARRSSADVLGMAGGDGSLAAVAEVALERYAAFVCVPFGTRNHFARDLGLDRDDPLAALAAFESGREVRIDVGRANGRLFLNN